MEDTDNQFKLTVYIEGKDNQVDFSHEEIDLHLLKKYIFDSKQRFTLQQNYKILNLLNNKIKSQEDNAINIALIVHHLTWNSLFLHDVKIWKQIVSIIIKIFAVKAKQRYQIDLSQQDKIKIYRYILTQQNININEFVALIKSQGVFQKIFKSCMEQNSSYLLELAFLILYQEKDQLKNSLNNKIFMWLALLDQKKTLNIDLSFYIARKLFILYDKSFLTIQFITFALKYCVLKHEQMIKIGKFDPKEVKFLNQILNLSFTKTYNQTLFNKFYLNFCWDELKQRNFYYLLKIYAYDFQFEVLSRIQKNLIIQINKNTIQQILKVFVGIPQKISFSLYKIYSKRLFQLLWKIKDRMKNQPEQSLLFTSKDSYIQKKASKKMSIKIEIKIESYEKQFILFQFLQPYGKSIIQVWQLQNWKITQKNQKHEWSVKFKIKYLFLDKNQKYQQKPQLQRIIPTNMVVQQVQKYIIKFQDKKISLTKVQMKRQKQEESIKIIKILTEQKFNLQIFTVGRSFVQNHAKTAIHSIIYFKDQRQENQQKQFKNKRKLNNISEQGLTKYECKIRVKKTFSQFILESINIEAIIFHNLQYIFRKYVKQTQIEDLKEVIIQNFRFLLDVLQNQENIDQRLYKTMLINLLSKNVELEDKCKFVQVCFRAFCFFKDNKQFQTMKNIQNYLKLVNNTRFIDFQCIVNAISAFKWIMSNQTKKSVKEKVHQNKLTKFYLQGSTKFIFFLYSNSKMLNFVQSIERSIQELFSILKLIFVDQLCFECKQIVNFMVFLIAILKFKNKLTSNKTDQSSYKKSQLYQAQNKSTSSRIDIQSGISNRTSTSQVKSFQVSSNKYLVYETIHLIKTFLQENLSKFKKKAQHENLIQILKLIRNQVKQTCINLFIKYTEKQKQRIEQIKAIFRQNEFDPQDVEALPLQVFRKHLEERGDSYKFYKFQQYFQTFLLLGKITQEDNILQISKIKIFDKSNLYHPSYIWKIFINALWKHQVLSEKQAVDKKVVQALQKYGYVLLSNLNTIELFQRYMQSKFAGFQTELSWIFLQRLNKFSADKILQILFENILKVPSDSENEKKIQLFKIHVVLYRINKITFCDFFRRSQIRQKINILFQCLLRCRKIYFMKKEDISQFQNNYNKREQFKEEIKAIIYNLKKIKQENRSDPIRCQVIECFMQNLQIQQVQELTQAQLCAFKQNFIAKQVQRTIQNWCTDHISNILMEYPILLKKLNRQDKSQQPTKLKKTVSLNVESKNLRGEQKIFKKRLVQSIQSIASQQLKRINLIKRQNQNFNINCSLTWKSYKCSEEQSKHSYYIIDSYCDPNNFRPFIKKINKNKNYLFKKNEEKNEKKNEEKNEENWLEEYRQQLCQIKNFFTEQYKSTQVEQIVKIEEIGSIQSNPDPIKINKNQSKNVFSALYITNQKFYQGKIALDKHGNILTFTQNDVVDPALYKELQTLDSQKRSKTEIVQKKMILNINLSQNCHMVKKSYLKAQNSLQIYITCSTYFFRFPDQGIRKQFLNNVKDFSRKLVNHEMASNYQNKWLRGMISNFQYLMKLNELSQRSFNDISQYYVFPWTVSNFKAEKIDEKFLQDSQNFRQLSYPMGKINPERFEGLKNRYEMSKERFGENVPLYGSFYSNPATTCYYLLRLHPFSIHHYRLQSGKFDLADRLFSSIQRMYNSVYSNSSDFKELIPQFYCSAEFLKNRNQYKFGQTQKKQKVNHVILPNWVKTQTAEQFVFKMRKILQCETVTKKLNNWIDLIFGIYNIENKAKEADNIFAEDVYRITNHKNDQKSMSFCLTYLKEFGQMPKNIYDKNHPQNLIGKNLNQLQLSSNKQSFFKKLIKTQTQEDIYSTFPFEMCEDIKSHQIQVISLKEEDKQKTFISKDSKEKKSSDKIQIFANYIVTNSGNLISFMTAEVSQIILQNCSIHYPQQKTILDFEVSDIKCGQLEESFIFIIIGGQIFVRKINRKNVSLFQKREIYLKQQIKINNITNVRKIVNVFSYLVIFKLNTIHFFNNKKPQQKNQKNTVKIQTSEFSYYECQKFYSANKICQTNTNQFLSLLICLDSSSNVTLFDIRNDELIKIRQYFTIQTLTYQQKIMKFQIHNMGYIIFWTNKNRVIMTNLLGQMIINTQIIFEEQKYVKQTKAGIKNISKQAITSLCIWNQEDSQILIGTSQGIIFKIDIFDLASKREPQQEIKKTIKIEETILSIQNTQHIRLGKFKNQIGSMKVQRFGRHWRLYCIIKQELFVLTSRLFVKSKLFSSLNNRERDS